MPISNWVDSIVYNIYIEKTTEANESLLSSIHEPSFLLTSLLCFLYSCIFYINTHSYMKFNIFCHLNKRISGNVDIILNMPGQTFIRFFYLIINNHQVISLPYLFTFNRILYFLVSKYIHQNNKLQLLYTLE